ncbi:MAG: DNA translocase FtsK [Kiritimatiellae bacterium]|nr:DNA translocase FtsK [Kiritimatiellia bacterium]
MSAARDDNPAIGRIWGMVLLALGLFLLLSLFSYVWTDISCLAVPPNDPTHNWIGPLGAWISFGLFLLFGVASYLLPFWCLAVGIVLVARSGDRVTVRGRIVWSGVLFFALAILLDFTGGLWESRLRMLNLVDVCGLFGRLVTRGLLVRWLSPIGTGIVTGCAVIASVIGMAGMGTAGRILYGLGQLSRSLREEFRNMIQARRERRQSGGENEDEIGRQRTRSERVVVPPREEVGTEEKKEVPVPPSASSTMPSSLAVADAQSSELRKRRGEATRSDGEPVTEPARKRKGEATEPAAYQLPPVTLLRSSPGGSSAALKTDTATTSRILVETLADFGIECQVTNVERGPVVTRYELLPAPGIRIERISGLSNNLALALKATSVRVQTPIPGKGVVGVEVPNSTANVVYLKEILTGPRWNPAQFKIPLALGKDVGGADLVADLADMPHLLIAGATGSGKTVCMNAILAGLLLSRKPSELRLLLVDPKIVEFSMYEHLPHLVVPVITDPRKVTLALRWAINEMERRYKLFARVGVRNIESFNHRQVVTQENLFKDMGQDAEEETPATLPYIVIVIDELADLMLTAQADIENCIARLAQLSRAVGIHMILSTQRPSVNVITGTIKANFPARIAFQVAQKVDSRTILDTVGAEKLLGRGDMLFLPPGTSKLVRAQGAMVSDEEIREIVGFIRSQAPPAYEMEIHEQFGKMEGSGEEQDAEEDEKLVAQALEIIRETHRASTSSLQRRLRIGYTRAARIMDILEERGIVGPPRGSDPREILVDLDAGIPNTGAENAEG